MAVVTYTCDVCKRSIDVPQNKKGLDVIQRCIITDQCKGKLHQESVNIDYSRGSLPPNVEGLTNWVQRKLLFNYSQTVNKEIWEINHNLNCLPVVVVYVLDESVSPAVLKEISLDEITLDIISNNQIKLTFSKPVSGQVQCIARATSATSTTSTSTKTIEDFQITNNGELSIASNNNVYGASNYIVLDFVFTTPTGLTITVPYSVDTTPSFQSPWSETTTLFIKNTKYKTRSFGAATASPFLDNSIPNGSILTGVSTSSTSDNIIILLANSPYSVFDAIDNEYISFKYIVGNVYVNDGELFAPASIIEQLQPAIIPILTEQGNYYSINGTISGLGLGKNLTLLNDGGDAITITGDGSTSTAFSFPTYMFNNDPYYVTVGTQPSAQLCVVTNGSGLATDNITNVTVSCSNLGSYTLGGNVTLFNSEAIVIQNNGGDELTLNSDGSFTFSNPLLAGSSYLVSSLTVPAGITATITNGSGIISGNVSNVDVTCTANPYNVGGNLSGLIDGSVTIQNNGGDDLTLSGDGSFNFVTPITYTSAYDVEVLTNPAGQTCIVGNNTGTMGSTDVTNVTVACSPNPYTVGGTVSGLSSSLTLLNSINSDSLVISSNGSYTFGTSINYNDPYNISVSVQPTGQTCVVSNAVADMGAGNVTNVDVTCTNNTYTVGGTVSGLSGSVTLQDNGGDDLIITTDGGFTFATPVEYNSTYSVTVSSQPAGQTCVVTSGSGTMGAGNVTGISVTCSAVAASDPFFNNVVLLLHGDGPNGSTTFTDSSQYGASMTRTGTQQIIATAESLFGGASIQSTNITYGPRIQTPSSSRYIPKTEFTIEFAIYLTSRKTGAYAITFGLNSDSGDSGFEDNNSAAVNLPWAGLTPTPNFGALTSNVWHRVAMTRDASNDIRTFVDGILIGTVNNTNTFSTITPVVQIGGSDASYSITGYMDEIRYTNGICRYTTNYTVDTAAFPDSGPTAINSPSITIDNPSSGFTWPGTGSVDFTVEGGPGVDYIYIYFNGNLVNTYDNSAYGDTDFSDSTGSFSVSAYNDCTQHTLHVVVQDVNGDTSVYQNVLGEVCF